MKFKETPLSGVYAIELEPFRDERGLFARTFCQKEFAKIGFDKQIVQINHSITKQKGTIRGMHYQRPRRQCHRWRRLGGRPAHP